MTYQYLTVEMVNKAKTNGGFIDQKMFKMAGKYGFDSLYLTETSMQVLDVIYQTRERVFHQDIQTPRSGLKKRGAAEFF